MNEQGNDVNRLPWINKLRKERKLPTSDGINFMLLSDILSVLSDERLPMQVGIAMSLLSENESSSSSSSSPTSFGIYTNSLWSNLRMVSCIMAFICVEIFFILLLRASNLRTKGKFLQTAPSISVNSLCQMSSIKILSKECW